MSDCTYLSPAETAKLVRQALKRKFPGQTFSVRARRYAGGGSIDVTWEDGPVPEDVEPVVKVYEGSGFDGSIDLKYFRTHYLKPDGTVLLHYDPGTKGSTGYHEGEDNRGMERLMPDEVKLVQFGADSVHCDRRRSNEQERFTEAERWIYGHCVIKDATGDPHRDRFGYYFVDGMAVHLVQHQKVDETLGQAFERLYCQNG